MMETDDDIAMARRAAREGKSDPFGSWAGIVGWALTFGALGRFVWHTLSWATID